MEANYILSGNNAVNTLVDVMTVAAGKTHNIFNIRIVNRAKNKNALIFLAITDAVVSELATPVISLTSSSGGTGSTCTYKVSAYDTNGETLASTEGSQVIANSVLDGTSYTTVTWGSVTGADGYRIYRKKDAETEYTYLAEVAGEGTTTYDDNGANPDLDLTPLFVNTTGARGRLFPEWFQVAPARSIENDTKILGITENQKIVFASNISEMDVIISADIS